MVDRQYTIVLVETEMEKRSKAFVMIVSKIAKLRYGKFMRTIDFMLMDVARF